MQGNYFSLKNSRAAIKLSMISDNAGVNFASMQNRMALRRWKWLLVNLLLIMGKHFKKELRGVFTKPRRCPRT